MLINLSHHPSRGWSDEQLEAARVGYGSVEDWPFPTIDPAWGIEAVQALVADYVARITQSGPVTVHVMGEMTFVYQLVQELRHRGIPCLASTTERRVEMVDGKKVVSFEFVAFRPYFELK